MTAPTTPITWTAGQYPTAALYNTEIRDNTSFLLNPPKCRAYNSANISINNSTLTALTFNSERFDTDTMHSTSANTGRITFTTAGLYLVGFHNDWALSAGGTYRQHRIRLNGTTDIAIDTRRAGEGNTGVECSMSTLYQFAAGDYVEAYVQQDSGGALNVVATGNFGPEFWAVWVGL
jgi:hypothetical protein